MYHHQKNKTTDYDEKAFDMVGPNAPQEVKDAWIDAAKEVNANGMGIRGNGMMSHISQMMVQRLNKMLKGGTENFDILGSTVESAIQATEKALYDLEHEEATRGMERSYPAKACPWDNACIENFHSLIKREWLNRFRIIDYSHAYRLVFEYIEAFYNKSNKYAELEAWIYI